MPRIQSAVVSSLLLLLASSCVTHRGQLYVGSSDYVLASRDGPSGSSEKYLLDVRGGDASIRVQTEYDKERPFLGFQLIELDKNAASRRNIKPYEGVLVQGTYPRSAARQGGVAPGDILTALDDREVIYLSQVADFEASLRDGQQVTARVLRDGKEMKLTLAAQSLKERVTGSESIALETVSPQKPYAGVTLRGVPTVWCEKIWGEKRNAVVVTNVEVGSPAWLAGMRGGDIIDRVDGMPVPSLATLSRAIAERGEDGEEMSFLVSRGEGESFEANVALHDYSGETNVWVPLVFHLENGVYQDRWTMGPFGLLLSNRNTYVPDSATRAVETRNVFSAVLGLLRVETAPNETSVRLLWLISFDT